MEASGQNRKFTYILVGVILGLGSLQFGGVGGWEGRQELFTLMALLSTLLAFFIGLVSFLTYFVKQEGFYLILGAGLCGTGFLEAYRLAVSGAFFERYIFWLPSQAPAWSSSIGTVFLSIVVLLTLWFWRRTQHPENGPIGKKAILAGIGILALAHLALSLFIPLPEPYLIGWSLGRPQELFAGFLFLLAATGYYRKGLWKTEALEHWILLSLIIAALGQLAYLPFSLKPFDLTAFTAQLLKQLSYLCILTGLVQNMYRLLQEAYMNRLTLAQSHRDLEGAKTGMEEETRRLVEGLADLETQNSRLEGLKKAMLNILEDWKEERPQSEIPQDPPAKITTLALTKR